MIVEGQEHKQEHKQIFNSKFYWTESSEGKWYLEKRECLPVEVPLNPDHEFIEFDHGEYDHTKDDSKKVNSGDWVICSEGKFKVDKIEEEKVYLDNGVEPLVLDLPHVKKFLNLNFLIMGVKKTYLLESMEISLNSYISDVRGIIAEYLILPEDLFILNFKDKVIECTSSVHELEIQEGDTMLVGFKSAEEIIFKRSSSRDYYWIDKKNLVPFKVDKNIIVSAFGFWRNYNSTPVAVYDFFLYEIAPDETRSLVCEILNVRVDPIECDTQGVKKVSIEKPVILKANLKYVAYVYYKLDLGTYHSYSCSSEQTVNGVRFNFLDMSEPGHRCSTSAGHVPRIYFKIYNPYED